MLFERPEAGGKAVLLQVELRRQKNPDQNEFVELARSAQIDVVHVEGVKRDAPHPVRGGSDSLLAVTLALGDDRDEHLPEDGAAAIHRIV